MIQRPDCVAILMWDGSQIKATVYWVSVECNELCNELCWSVRDHRERQSYQRLLYAVFLTPPDAEPVFPPLFLHLSLFSSTLPEIHFHIIKNTQTFKDGSDDERLQALAQAGSTQFSCHGNGTGALRDKGQETTKELFLNIQMTFSFWKAASSVIVIQRVRQHFSRWRLC